MARPPWPLVAVLATLALLPSVAAHSAGEAPVEATGSLPLDPGNPVELELTSLGAVEGGDILHLQWSVNDGAGPAVRFEIWAGEGMAHEQIYAVEGVSDDLELALPEAGAYQAVWTNDGGESVTLDYRLEVTAPQGDAFLNTLPLVLLAAAGVLFVYLLWRGRRRKEEPTEAGAE